MRKVAPRLRTRALETIEADILIGRDSPNTLLQVIETELQHLERDPALQPHSPQTVSQRSPEGDTSIREDSYTSDQACGSDAKECDSAMMNPSARETHMDLHAMLKGIEKTSPS